MSVLRSKLLPTLDTGKFNKNCDSGPAFEAWSSAHARDDQKGRIQSINLLLRVFMDLAVKSRGEVINSEKDTELDIKLNDFHLFFTSTVR